MPTLDGPRVLRGPDLGEHHAVGAAVLFVTGPRQGVRRVGRAIRTCGKHTDIVTKRLLNSVILYPNRYGVIRNPCR